MTERGKVVLHPQLPSLAELMVKADLAIGAAGSTTWERCSLGLFNFGCLRSQSRSYWQSYS